MSEALLLMYSLVFLRIIAFVVAMPIIGTAQIAIQIKLFLAITITLVVAPLLPRDNIESILLDDRLWSLSLYQVAIGLLLGFIGRFFLFSLAVAGDWIGISSGSSSAQIFNPAQGTTGSVFDQFFVIIASLLFFALNAHHVLIQTLVTSFTKVHPLQISFGEIGTHQMINHFIETIVFGIKLALPVAIPILVANVVMGVMARIVPQLNVFVTSLQVTFIITIAVLLISLPLLFDEYQNLISNTLNRVNQMVEALDG